MQRPVFKTLGVLFVAIGLIGVVVPLLPTTIFFILAATCFARSSPELERRIMEHRRFGPPVRAWRDHGVISRRAKVVALCGMAMGFVFYLMSTHPGPIAALLVAAVLLACAAFVASRPSRAPGGA